MESHKRSQPGQTASEVRSALLSLVGDESGRLDTTELLQDVQDATRVLEDLVTLSLESVRILMVALDVLQSTLKPTHSSTATETTSSER